MEKSVLCADDSPAVRVSNRQGRGPFVLVCEHASNRLPKALSNLVDDPSLLEMHVAWDPGAEAVSQLLSDQLDAPLITSGYSRLVYDVNRPVDSPQAIVVQSEGHDIAGNRELSAAAADERANALYHPFHGEISAMLDRRAEEGLDTALVTVHSFTPVFLGVRRETELGILHDDDARLADALMAVAPSFSSLKVGRNKPYAPKDGVTHTLRRHAIPRGLLNVMIEIRNDLLRSEEQRQAIAESLSAMLRAALSSLVADPDLQAEQG